MPFPTVEYHQGEYTISTDRQRLNLEVIHDFLTHRSYWAQGVPMPVVQKAIKHSLCFGVYRGAEQVGFARVTTDYATIAVLQDVFILENERGNGLSKWLVARILEHPELQGLRVWMLNTRDAHGLYARFGFEPLKDPSLTMRKTNPNPYASALPETEAP